MPAENTVVTPTAFAHAQRTQIVRGVAEVLSAEMPLDELWSRSLEPLSRLTGGGTATIVLEERLNTSVSAVAAALADAVLQQRRSVQIKERRAVGVPIRFGDRLLGAICVEDAPVVDDEVVSLLESCGLFAGARLNREMLLRDTARYEQLALTDALTGLANRRRFDEALPLEWARARREGVPLAVLMLDVDFFKPFNDGYGHQAGDLCLQQIAHAIAETADGPLDIAARYGGEEFVVLRVNVGMEEAVAAAERLRLRFEALNIAHAGSSLGHVSVSIGVAVVVPDMETEPSSLLHTADVALYGAKRAGRNRVFTAGDHSKTTPVSPSGVGTPNNLPLQFTPFVGRRREVDALKTLVAERTLVTVMGVGGSGKTRVALQVATEFLGTFADGAWFADLSALADAQLVAPTICAIFSRDVPRDPNKAAARLLEILKQRRLLLVLDNCEHLLQTVESLVRSIREECPGVHVLATSRAPFEVSEQEVYRLPLLSMPSLATAAIDAETALTYDAVKLFVQRAKAAKPTFELTDENALDVVEICRRLDGIALAVELAAARIGVVGLRQLASLLTHRLRVLTGGDRTAPARRQTMRALIDWSYELLSERERLLFTRLAVFAGGCTPDAVREVCEDDQALAIVAELVQKSLVVDDITGGQRRYRLLDSIHEYAKERLDSSSEKEALAARHARYFLRVAKDAQSRRSDASARQIARRAELENFRAAIHWALESDALLAGELAIAFHEYFSHLTGGEVARWAQLALDRLTAVGGAPALEAQLLLELSRSAMLSPEDDLAACRRAVAIARELDDPLLLTFALRMMAQTLSDYFPERHTERKDAALDALEAAKRANSPLDIALARKTYHMDALLHIDGDLETLRRATQECIVLARVHGPDRMLALQYNTLSEVEFAAGEYVKAMAHSRDVIRIADEVGATRSWLFALENFPHYATAAREWSAAREGAATLIRNAREAGWKTGPVYGILALAEVSAAVGDLQNAAVLLGFCLTRFGQDVHLQQTGCQAKAFAALNGSLREELDPPALQAALEAGARLTEDEAVALALASSRESRDLFTREDEDRENHSDDLTA